jgi:PPP family 3-phenylpropionic acid transporter
MRFSAAIALYYFTLLGALGLFMPYFAIYLKELGLQPAEITRLLSISPIMSLVVPPLCGLIADSLRLRVWLLRGMSAATALAFTRLLRTEGESAALAASVAVFALCRAPLTSMADACAVDHCRRLGGSYGRLRLWGSLGFMIAVLGGGVLLDRFGLPGVLGAALAAFGLLSVSAWGMPAPSPHGHTVALTVWRDLLARRDLWLFFAATVLTQAGGAAYDSCFSLHLARLGYSGRTTGLAFAVGVLAEIVLLAHSQRILNRVGAERLFTASIATAGVRWFLLAHAGTRATLLALQPLHGVTFSLYYVAGVTIVRDRSGAAVPTAAQGLFAAAVGMGSVVGMSFAGALFQQGGGVRLYETAALLALGGAALASGFERLAQRNRGAPRAVRVA